MIILYPLARIWEKTSLKAQVGQREPEPLRIMRKGGSSVSGQVMLTGVVRGEHTVFLVLFPIDDVLLIPMQPVYK